MITTRFESAVDRVTPGQGKKRDRRGDRSARERALHGRAGRQRHPDQLCGLHGPAQTLRKRRAAGLERPAAAPGAAAAPVRRAGRRRKALAAKPAPAAGPEGRLSVSETGSGDKVFTGEKIALDFYDTDIKNVFRILQEISGKNFAIDKNVTGKVTLALQRPVPWDQVLDLVLEDEPARHGPRGRHHPHRLAGHPAAGREDAPGPAQGGAGSEKAGGGGRAAGHRVHPGQLLQRQVRGPAAPDQHPDPEPRQGHGG
ncbi:MAG: hypothetical protein MZV70_45970 [Desulfobacterales bacterium]|nr:hypothetical protein [Desulfobacterales bacterium]